MNKVEYHNVELKCSATPMGNPFVLKIDGKDIHHVRKVSVNAEFSGITIVEIEILANVNAEIEAKVESR